MLPLDYEQAAESDTKLRWYSVLNTGRAMPNKASARSQLNFKNGLFLGTRYESTAAESDASSPPPLGEKYEYQAEVCLSNREANLFCI